MAVGNVMPWRGYPSSTNLAQRCGQRLSTLPPYHQLLTQVRNREDRYEIQYTGLSVGGAATPWHTRGLDQARPPTKTADHPPWRDSSQVIEANIYIFISPTGSTSKQEKNQQSIKSHDRA